MDINFWDYLKDRPFYFYLFNVKYIFKCIKWSFQRAIRGYSDYDLQSADLYVSNLIESILREFAYHLQYEGVGEDAMKVASLFYRYNEAYHQSFLGTFDTEEIVKLRKECFDEFVKVMPYLWD